MDLSVFCFFISADLIAIDERRAVAPQLRVLKAFCIFFAGFSDERTMELTSHIGTGLSDRTVPDLVSLILYMYDTCIYRENTDGGPCTHALMNVFASRPKSKSIYNYLLLFHCIFPNVNKPTGQSNSLKRVQIIFSFFFS